MSKLIWKEREIKTLGGIGKAIEGILKSKDPQVEADAFMKLYRADTPHADENIGYISGYYDSDKMRRIQELFCVVHPVFGNKVPTPKEAFEMGKKLGSKRES